MIHSCSPQIYFISIYKYDIIYTSANKWYKCISTTETDNINCTQGGKGETPLVLHPYSTHTPSILHWYFTSTPLEKKYQWSRIGVEWSSTGVEWSSTGVEPEYSGIS
jgi:hypothetical protein